MSDARDLKPGDKLRHPDGDVFTLDRRKDDNSGWWLGEGGGLSDRAITTLGYELIEVGGDV